MVYLFIYFKLSLPVKFTNLLSLRKQKKTLLTQLFRTSCDAKLQSSRHLSLHLR